MCPCDTETQLSSQSALCPHCSGKISQQEGDKDVRVEGVEPPKAVLWVGCPVLAEHSSYWSSWVSSALCLGDVPSAILSSMGDARGRGLSGSPDRGLFSDTRNRAGSREGDPG